MISVKTRTHSSKEGKFARMAFETAETYSLNSSPVAQASSYEASYAGSHSGSPMTVVWNSPSGLPATSPNSSVGAPPSTPVTMSGQSPMQWSSPETHFVMNADWLFESDPMHI